MTGTNTIAKTAAPLICMQTYPGRVDAP